MSVVLDELVKLLTLEPIEENLFRGQSQDLGWGTVFGGQVIGQALSAAVQTVPRERPVHSLHAYFLRPGDVTRPVLYQVARVRDGGSFTTRNVIAVQHGEAIFTLSASFQITEPGFEHQVAMPKAPPPASVLTDQERLAPFSARFPQKMREGFAANQTFELRIVGPEKDPFSPQPQPAHRQMWMKANGSLPDDQALHAYLLAYVSDRNFLPTSLLPHGVTWLSGTMQVASLDHAMWFHQPARVDEWLLHAMESPEAHGARGLVRGQIFSRDGRLIASTTQEGLIRQRETRDTFGPR